MTITIDIPETKIRAQATRDGVTHFSTGVAAMRGGKLLVVRRAAHDHLGGVYELPGGGVEEAESIAEGAIREFTEETGLTITKVVKMFDGFDYQTDRKPKVRQLNFVVEVANGEVKLDQNEHDEHRWITAEDIGTLQATDNMKRCLYEVFNDKSAAKIYSIKNKPSR